MLYSDTAVLNCLGNNEPGSQLSHQKHFQMKMLKRLLTFGTKKTEELMFELFNFQLHVGFKNLYQNFQGGAKKIQEGQMPLHPP